MLGPDEENRSGDNPDDAATDERTLAERHEEAAAAEVLTTWNQGVRAMMFFGPASRLAFGVLGLMMSLFLLLDLFVDVVPDRADMAARLRGRLSESLTVQVTALIQADQRGALRRDPQAGAQARRRYRVDRGALTR